MPLPSQSRRHLRMRKGDHAIGEAVICDGFGAFGVELEARESGIVTNGRGHEHETRGARREEPGRCRVERAEAKPLAGWADHLKSSMRLEGSQ